MATEAEDITDPSSSDDATVSIADMKWDPLASPDWELHKHTSEAIIRIKRDLYTIFNDPPPGVFIVPHKDDITRIHILMNGPFDTPYEGGYFYFILRFPPDYPYSPPRVKFMTTAGGTVRFNPNLYADGKVCLSVLGTWAGPQWSPSQNLLSLIVSMQTLLNDKPYHNEPGHEGGGELKVKDYNDIIRHETLRVAVCDVLEHDLYPKDLMDVIRPSFIDYYHFYTSTVKDNSKHDGNVMKDPFNINKGTFNYHKLLQRLEALHLKLKSAT